MAIAQFGDVEFGESEFGESTLGTLSTPTITVTADATLARLEVAVTNPGDSPDYNEIWRFISGEAAIRLTATLPSGGTYYDYDVASGVTHFYFARAAYIGGTYAESSTHGELVTFSNLRIHAVQKGADTNLYGTAYELFGGESQSRPHARAQEVLITPALGKAIIATGEVVTRSWSGQVFAFSFSLAAVQGLKALQALRRTLCMRDGLGNILFGTLAPLSVSYDVTSVVSFNLIETDFNQHIA